VVDVKRSGDYGMCVQVRFEGVGTQYSVHLGRRWRNQSYLYGGVHAFTSNSHSYVDVSRVRNVTDEVEIAGRGKGSGRITIHDILWELITWPMGSRILESL